MRSGIFLQSGLRGMDPEEAFKNIAKILPASIILFNSDFQTQKDLRNIIDRINRIYVIENNVPQPVIAIDQEGGNVVRLPWLEYNPSNLFLGMVNDEKFTNYVGKLTGFHLYEEGIKWNMAPVLDLLNPYNKVIMERSFGSDPLLVALHGAAYISGLQYNGVHATVKHFPGHGGVLEDSHLVLPVDKRSYDTIMNDAYPFKVAIENKVDSVMLSHVIYNEIDPDFPASISPKIQSILRNKFFFNGLTITDSIDMNALAKNFTKEEIVKNTLLNDVDMIESADLNDSLEIVEYINKIDKTKLGSKISTINKFIQLRKAPIYNPGTTLLKSIEYIYPKVRRKIDLDPKKRIYIVYLEPNGNSPVFNLKMSNLIQSKELEDLNIDVEIRYGIESINNIEKGSQVVFITYNEHLRSRYNIINNFCINHKCAVISTGVDVDIGIFSEKIGYVSAYSTKPRVIIGAILKLIY